MFQLYKVSHFNHSFLDHRPTVVDMIVDSNKAQVWHFKFEVA